MLRDIGHRLSDGTAERERRGGVGDGLDGRHARHARGLSGASEADPQQAGCLVVNVLNDDNPYAFHPGGVGAVMGDGSVTFMANEIDATVFSALVSRDGSEVVARP